MSVFRIVLAAAFAFQISSSLACAADPTASIPATAAPQAASQETGLAAPATGGDFTEVTRVVGKPDVSIRGIYLVNAWFLIGTENYQTIPELVKVTEGKEGLEFHILDVELPEIAQAELKKVNQTRPRPRWIPSQEVLKAIADQWQKLPRRAIKGPADNIYGTVEYLVAAPDQYQGAFPIRDQQLDKVLDGSKFAIQINENYKPQSLRGAQVAPLITRRTVYGTKSVEKEVIKGDQVTGFISAGSGQPLPISVAGDFGMFRATSEK